MNVRSLRYALTLSEELHFGRAAQVHYIAAQAFGRHIAELERELGVKLFERTSRRVALTAAGEQVMPRARRILSDLDALMPETERRRDDSVLRVGVVGFGLADRWSATRELLAHHHPDLALTFVELDWATQYDAVRSGEVDVAIVHDVGGADDLSIDAVMHTERCAVVPVESELADAARLTEADVADRPCVTPVGQPGLVDWSAGSPSRGGIEVRSPTAIPLAVVTTGLLGLQAEPATRFLPHPKVSYVPLDGPSAVVALASRDGDDRAKVAAFRTAVHASAAWERNDVTTFAGAGEADEAQSSAASSAACLSSTR